MKFEIKFNEEIYLKQIQLLYDLAYSKEISFYKNSNYVGFSLLAVGVIILYEKPSFFGVALLIFALVNLIPFYTKFYKRKSLLRKLDIEKKATIAFYNQNPLSQWEFSENTFKYVDINGEVSLDWKEFKTYEIIDETIFMFTKSDNPYILGKVEIGEENFEKITELIDNKIKTSS
ncbi:MAG: hypothetical protein KGZ81_03650 [Flavobacteriales bacterium]|nr:hypothetical protein [Flavobacteriales bacterium]